jgi:hypothetical protein
MICSPCLPPPLKCRCTFLGCESIMDKDQRRLVEELLFPENKKPSFAKLLYQGVFDSGHTFPYPKADEIEQRRTEELLAKLKFFCEKEINPAAIDREARIPESVIKGLGEL